VRFSRKRYDGSSPIFFQDLGEKDLFIQPELKLPHPAFKDLINFLLFIRRDEVCCLRSTFHGLLWWRQLGNVQSKVLCIIFQYLYDRELGWKFNQLYTQ